MPIVIVGNKLDMKPDISRVEKRPFLVFTGSVHISNHQLNITSISRLFVKKFDVYVRKIKQSQIIKL